MTYHPDLQRAFDGDQERLDVAREFYDDPEVAPLDLTPAEIDEFIRDATGPHDCGCDGRNRRATGSLAASDGSRVPDSPDAETTPPETPCAPPRGVEGIERGSGRPNAARPAERHTAPHRDHVHYGLHGADVEAERDRARQLAADLEAENARLTEGLREIAADHECNTRTWRHANFPTELAARWHDGYISALASHAIKAKKFYDPEGAAEDERVWQIGCSGSDLDWYRETGHCGHCGVVATNCQCTPDDPCGCFEEHGPRKEPYVSPEQRAERAEATLARVRSLYGGDSPSNRHAYCISPDALLAALDGSES